MFYHLNMCCHFMCFQTDNHVHLRKLPTPPDTLLNSSIIRRDRVIKFHLGAILNILNPNMEQNCPAKPEMHKIGMQTHLKIWKRFHNLGNCPKI